MSVKMMAEVWSIPDLNQSQTLVALAIADCADDEGFAFPSVERIAGAARISSRQTQRVIRQLEAMQILSVDRSRCTGRGLPAHYQFAESIVTAAAQSGQFRLKKPPADPLKKGDTMTPHGEKGCHQTSKKGDIAVSPEPSDNHQEEKSAPSAPTTFGIGYDWSEIEGLDVEAWIAWLRYRSASRFPPYRTLLQAREVAELPPAQQRQVIDYSMRQQYQGLFPEKANREAEQRSGGRTTRFEQQNRALDEWLAAS